VNLLSISTEVAAKAREIFNLYSADLASTDNHHRDLFAAVLANLPGS
jgi:hypothetical protein